MPLLDRAETFRAQVLQRIRPELAPGAEHRLAHQQWWNAPPSEFVGALVEFVDSHEHFRHPGYAPPAGESKLQRLLRILPVSDQARERIAAEKHLAWGGMDTRTLGRRVVEYLHRPGNESLHAVAPPRNSREERLAGILSTHFGEIDRGTREQLATRWANDFLNVSRTDAEVVTMLARRLSIAAAAAAAGVSPLDPGDDRLNAAAREKVEQAEAAAPRTNAVYGSPY